MLKENKKYLNLETRILLASKLDKKSPWQTKAVYLI